MIKSPFNFVPCSSSVFYPDMLGEPSVDLPFSDSISGSINLKITAETPLFIRNGHTKEDDENKTEAFKSFSMAPDGRYFIPSASVKGCIRNVVSIMSSGEMRVDPSAAFTQRDFANRGLYTLLEQKTQTTIHCGWLRSDDLDNYTIVDCGVPYRISLKEIDDFFNETFGKANLLKRCFSKDSDFDLNTEIKAGGFDNVDPKTSRFKYLMLQDNGINPEDYTGVCFFDKGQNRCSFDPNGNICGDIVFTGQPDQAKHWDHNELRGTGAGKFYEFIFRTDGVQTRYQISQEMFDRYEFMYADSKDWEYHAKNLKGKGIPVFFRLDGNGVKDFGLAYMYKLPYENSPLDIENRRRQAGSKDMADRLFGRISKEGSLKGRVSFSNFFSDNAAPDQEYKCVLGQPKASYYPLYIKQETDRTGRVPKPHKFHVYKTYDGESSLSGWKMYLRRNNIWINAAESDKVNTCIYPVKTGSTFTGAVTFHNLRPEELGALLSAITFYGNEGLHHMLGQGKPYGFGKVRIEAELSSPFVDIQGNEVSAEQAMRRYAWLLKANGFSLQKNAAELFQIAGSSVNEDERYRYMKLDMKGDNDFVMAKTNGEALLPMSVLSPKVVLKNLDDHLEDIDAFYEKQQEEAKEKARQEELRKMEQASEEARLAAQKLEADAAAMNVVEWKPLDLFIENATSVGSLTSKIKQWLKFDQSNMGSDELNVVADRIRKFAPKPKELKSKRKDFEKVLGVENAGILYNLIVDLS